jgi:hypothetical protein
MKFLVRYGHSKSGADTSADGILNESDCIYQYAPYVTKYLREQGHEVIECKVEYASSLWESLSKGIDMANANNVDYFISCHVNAGGGTGCEVLYNGGNQDGKNLATRVSNSISNVCGYRNRGSKSDVRGLAEIKKPYATTIIIEPFFCDTQADCDRFNPQLLGKAIVEGILNIKINQIPQFTTNDVSIIFNVVADEIIVYEHPDWNSKPVSKYVRGNIAYVNGRTNNEWYRVDFQGKPAYIYDNGLAGVEPLQENTTIGDVVEMLFNDELTISDYAKDAVKELFDKGLIKGSDDGNFYPQNNLTREDFCVVIQRLLRLLGK